MFWEVASKRVFASWDTERLCLVDSTMLMLSSGNHTCAATKECKLKTSNLPKGGVVGQHDIFWFA